MMRYLVVFLALFAGAAACISLLPSPPKVVASRSAVAAQLHQEAEPAAAPSNVRVVYPASGASNVSAPSVPVSTASDAVSVTASAASPLEAPAGAVYPQAQRVADTSPSAAVPPDAAAQAGTPGLNLNTASIDALNQIPGAGRIGRTIASHRPYRSVEDLLTKRVVKKSVYERIKAQVAAE